MYGCEWLDNTTLQDSGKYPCEYVKKNWNEDTMPTPYPCLAIENYVATQNLAVTVAAATKPSYWGTAVSDMQSNIAVSGNKITGTLKYLAEGQLVTDWGAGNFLASGKDKEIIAYCHIVRCKGDFEVALAIMGMFADNAEYFVKEVISFFHIPCVLLFVMLKSCQTGKSVFF